MRIIVLKYNDGTFVSKNISGNSEHLYHTDGVSLECASIFPSQKIAERCKWTLEDKGFFTNISIEEVNEEFIKFQLFTEEQNNSNTERRKLTLTEVWQSQCSHNKVEVQDFIFPFKLVCLKCKKELLQPNNLKEVVEFKETHNIELMTDLGTQYDFNNFDDVLMLQLRIIKMEEEMLTTRKAVIKNFKS